MSAVAGEIAGRWSRAGLLPARSVLRVFALSRLVVLAAAVAATTLIPRAPTWAAADWTGISAHLGSLGNVLGSAAIRWDALWYLRVASHGYRTLQETGRFPLYPLLIRVGSLFTGSTVIAAVVISVAATCGALLIVWRLTLLELGPEAAPRPCGSWRSRRSRCTCQPPTTMVCSSRSRPVRCTAPGGGGGDGPA